MSRYWSPLVHQLTPYVPGEQPRLARLVKLNTNECPYGPSPRVLEALRAEVADSLRLYPDPNAERLKAVIAQRYGRAPNEVFVGNGSDEVLAHVFMAFFRQKQPVLFPDITYSFYPVYAQLYEIATRLVPLDERFQIDIGDYRQPNGGIIIANPNAPTGCALPLADIEALCQANTESVVVIDEAYVDFGAESAVELIARFPQLLVVHTLSKSRALAGLRVGWALGQHDLIEALERVKNCFNSYPLDRLAQAGAIAAIEDEGYFQNICAKVVATRERMTSQLRALGFEVLPSAANFLFARHPQRDAATIAARLREQGIIVRHFKSARIEQFLRISVGDEEQARLLLGALAE
ncbi:MAG: histidinol-phosphate transaminase [Burkholderiales bacterium]|nr:MAG: histidinol-phosphate transaminase [Burkholderiales bacterium]